MSKHKIKILFALGNTASMPDSTMQALNKLDDIEARGISVGKHQYLTFGPNWTILEYTSIRKNPFLWFLQVVKIKYQLFRHILWADICMWHWDIDAYSHFFIKLFKKPIFVEWVGSDIRVPEILFKFNHFFKNCWGSGEYSYYLESIERSNRIQNKFASLHAVAMVAPEMSLYVNQSIYTSHIPFFQRMNLSNFKPAYPLTSKQVARVVHTPSATGAKGTKFVRQAIQHLTEEGLQFEYIEIHNKTRQESLNAIQQADIFLDQFICGGYGIATCEAMAMGKPVFCYLIPEVVALLPPDCPIVNTNPDTLEAMLRKFLSDPVLRHEAGKASRKYAEQYHDADKIALDLEKLFKQTLNK